MRHANAFVMSIALAALGASACTIERVPEGKPYADSFDSLQPIWNATGPGIYSVESGELVVRKSRNHPLWLSQPIPQNAVIELDAWSNDPAGDIKFEAWGDGKSYATTTSYTATSYVFIFGGWNNTTSAICRMDEHANNRRARSDTKVEQGKHYHFRVERRGGKIDWQIDGKPFLQFNDGSPLTGAEHAYFGFNDWEAEVHFDNLKITAL